MPEAEVLYSDVKFTKKKGDTTEAASSSLDTTYAEVKILGTQPSNEQPEAASSSLDTTYSEFKILGTQPSNEQPASQQVVSDGGSKVKSKKVALIILCILLAVVVVVLCSVLYGAGKMTGDSCLKCDKGWKEFEGKCYYFSNKTSSWEESKHYCRSLEGDLVKIDSEEEQRFLTKEVSEKMNNEEDKFWIGLTDSKNESNWFWVDGSPLDTSLTFWRKGEPDDLDDSAVKNPEGEDCVRMGEKGGPAELKCWTDKSCKVPHRSICEARCDVFLKSS